MTATTFQVRPFDARSAPQVQRLAAGQLLTDAFSFAYPDDPPLLPEREAISLTHVSPDEVEEQFVVWDDQRAIGWGSVTYNLVQNTHMAFARLVVHPTQRRRGIATSIRHELERVARREKRRIVTFGTSSRAPAGEAFARHLHAQPALPMKVSRLELAQVDWPLMHAWQQRPGNDPYRLHTWTVIPDEYLERAAQMMMVMNTAPKGELDMQDWQITPEMIRAWDKMIEESGEQRTFMAAEDTRSGQLAGYTEVFWTPERAALVYQGATAVRPDARGQGLGKWLKAAMLEYVQANYHGARWIRTNNANVNAAMLSINVAMGFQPWASFTEWQLSLE